MSTVMAKEVVEVSKALLEYQKAIGDKKNQLESEYITGLFNSDMNKCYDVLKLLVDYKLIDSKDDRLQKNYILFSDESIVYEEYIGKRVKSMRDDIPNWVYCDNPLVIHFIAVSRQRKVQGVEYNGALDCPDRILNMELREVRNKKEAANIIGGMGAFLENKSKKKLDVLKNEAIQGCTRIYSINVNSNILDKHSKFGMGILYKDIWSERDKYIFYGTISGEIIKYYNMNKNQVVESLAIEVRKCFSDIEIKVEEF